MARRIVWGVMGSLHPPRSFSLCISPDLMPEPLALETRVLLVFEDCLENQALLLTTFCLNLTVSGCWKSLIFTGESPGR